MKQKSVLAGLLAATLSLTSLLFSGCGKAEVESPDPDITNAEEETQQSEIIAFEDIQFPDELPSQPTLAEDDYYSYDDMSQHYEIEFLTMNYGVEVPENDPIKAWLEEKYNVTITFTTCMFEDLENILSTRFSTGEAPDLFMVPSQNYGFTLGEQGLLVDAREMYPYMPQTCKFATKNMIKWSTMDNGTIPFITKYSVQDGNVWGLVLRQDWLNNLNMQMPSTMEELKEYARAVTYDDPDGNGKDDTWFMLAAGGGNGLEMLNAFKPFFGNPSEHIEDGELSAPMLNGTIENWIAFLHELYDMGVLAPDWFTIDWQGSLSYVMGDKIGMVNYPADALLTYYYSVTQDPDACENWAFLDSLPDGAKGNPGGDVGYLWGIPTANVKDNPGKLMRILHIMDTMTYGGESYLEVSQGGGNEVHNGDYGIRKYLDDGTFICFVAEDHPGYTVYGSDNLALAPWQTFGYTVNYRYEYCEEGDKMQHTVERINESKAVMGTWERWPNDSLLVSVSGDIAPNLEEFELSQYYKFIVGERSMDEWDEFINEWLDQGGRDVLTAKAEKLGVDLPDAVK